MRVKHLERGMRVKWGKRTWRTVEANLGWWKYKRPEDLEPRECQVIAYGGWGGELFIHAYLSPDEQVPVLTKDFDPDSQWMGDFD